MSICFSIFIISQHYWTNFCPYGNSKDCE